MAVLIFRFSARAQLQAKPLQRTVTTEAELWAPRSSGYGSQWGTDIHTSYAATIHAQDPSSFFS